MIDQENPDITVDRKFIVYVAEVDSAVKKKYNDLFGSKLITTPEEKKIIV